jgi:hypothetical protein
MTFLGTIGAVLPLGLAAALSTVPIAVVITLLLSQRATANGIAYLVGQFVGVIALTLALGSGLSLLPNRQSVAHDTLAGAVEILIGATLVVYGTVGALRRRKTPSEVSQRWLRRLHTIPPRAALGFGLLLNVRPKALLLVIAAGLAIAGGDLSVTETVISSLVYAVLATSIVAGTVIAHLARPIPTARWLENARTWLGAHGQLIAMIVSILIGVVLIGNGLGRIAQ